MHLRGGSHKGSQSSQQASLVWWAALSFPLSLLLSLLLLPPLSLLLSPPLCCRLHCQSAQQVPLAWWAACAMHPAARMPVLLQARTGRRPLLIGPPITWLCKWIIRAGNPSKVSLLEGQPAPLPGFSSTVGMLWLLSSLAHFNIVRILVMDLRVQVRLHLMPGLLKPRDSRGGTTLHNELAHFCGIYGIWRRRISCTILSFLTSF